MPTGGSSLRRFNELRGARYTDPALSDLAGRLQDAELLEALPNHLDQYRGGGAASKET